VKQNRPVCNQVDPSGGGHSDLNSDLKDEALKRYDKETGT